MKPILTTCYSILYNIYPLYTIVYVIYPNFSISRFRGKINREFTVYFTIHIIFWEHPVVYSTIYAVRQLLAGRVGRKSLSWDDVCGSCVVQLHVAAAGLPLDQAVWRGKCCQNTSLRVFLAKLHQGSCFVCVTATGVYMSIYNV